MRKYCLSTRFILILIAVLTASSQTLIPMVHATQHTDDFIHGYATAVIAMHYPGRVKTISVADGVIYLEGSTLSEKEKAALSQVLSHINGVITIEFVPEKKRMAETDVIHGERKEAAALEEYLPVFLPKNQLFHPLIADPRWPRFSASYQRYRKGDGLRNVGSVSFGESFSIYRFYGPWESTMELGVQAAVFSIFDLDAESFDLINADYLIGLPVTIKKGNFTNMTRVSHMSSHLGDEYLLRGGAEEIRNVSYESIDTLFSYDLPVGFRVYGGGGYFFNQSPSDLNSWSIQGGVEFYSPWRWLRGAVRPVAGLDVQNRQQDSWSLDLSIRAGIQFENPDFWSRKMILLLEYYNGNSPNGQFYDRTVEYFGLGLHFFLE